MTFKVNLRQRAKEITEQVWHKTKVPMQDQVLQLGSKTLKSQRTLSLYGIDKETKIHFTLKVVKPTDEQLPLVLVEPGDEEQRHDLQGSKALKSPFSPQREVHITLLSYILYDLSCYLT
ncbi:hypothetical protein E5288_WYG005288 [Bos mutus]|uniref:Ubiquitin-like domain-containing protein n=1 Tax=Bos mutus TaxID=72004 RepID=A0A6B0SBP0_9CETA|nr:hypothetical protein [Bos mutus]